jgi:hypothetical protein
MWTEAVAVSYNIRHYPRNCLEKQRKMTRNLSQESMWQRTKLRLPKCISEALPLEPNCLAPYKIIRMATEFFKGLFLAFPY